MSFQESCISFPHNPSSVRGVGGAWALLLRKYMWFPVWWRSQGRKQQIRATAPATGKKTEHTITVLTSPREGAALSLSAWCNVILFTLFIVAVIVFPHPPYCADPCRIVVAAATFLFTTTVCHLFLPAPSPCWTFWTVFHDQKIKSSTVRDSRNGPQK